MKGVKKDSRPARKAADKIDAGSPRRLHKSKSGNLLDALDSDDLYLGQDDAGSNRSLTRSPRPGNGNGNGKGVLNTRPGVHKARSANDNDLELDRSNHREKALSDRHKQRKLRASGRDTKGDEQRPVSSDAEGPPCRSPVSRITRTHSSNSLDRSKHREKFLDARHKQRKLRASGRDAKDEDDLDSTTHSVHSLNDSRHIKRVHSSNSLDRSRHGAKSLDDRHNQRALDDTEFVRRSSTRYSSESPEKNIATDPEKPPTNFAHSPAPSIRSDKSTRSIDTENTVVHISFFLKKVGAGVALVFRKYWGHLSQYLTITGTFTLAMRANYILQFGNPNYDFAIPANSGDKKLLLATSFWFPFAFMLMFIIEALICCFHHQLVQAAVDITLTGVR